MKSSSPAKIPPLFHLLFPPARPRSERERTRLFARRFAAAFTVFLAGALLVNSISSAPQTAPETRVEPPKIAARPIMAQPIAANAPAISGEAPAPIFKVADGNLNEISGFAASRSYPGFWWAHNDSGDTARLFLLSSEGKTVATVNLEGVEARDWEDMAAAGGYLYVADIGDNFRVMENVQIHRIWEPKIDTKKLGQQISLSNSTVETAKIAYPDGARDAETFAVAPDGTFLIVSKNLGGSNFYLSQTPFRRGAVALKKIGGPFVFGGQSVFSKMATAGDLSRDGKKLAVTTYTQLYEFALGVPFDLASIQLKTPKIQNLPTLQQCESAAYDLSSAKVVVSSEKKNPPVYALDSGWK